MAFGFEEWLIVLVVVLVLFGGGSQIPKLMRSLGRARGEFTKGRMEMEAEMRAGASTPAPSDDQVRATARGLGIDDKGKDTSQLKAEIAQKLA